MSAIVVFCDCRCHQSPDLDWNPVGVDTRDPIAAEAACSKCKPHHCRTFLDDPPSEPLPRGDVSTAWIDVEPAEGRE